MVNLDENGGMKRKIFTSLTIIKTENSLFSNILPTFAIAISGGGVWGTPKTWEIFGNLIVSRDSLELLQPSA
jgi:hypothetical protein